MKLATSMTKKMIMKTPWIGNSYECHSTLNECPQSQQERMEQKWVKKTEYTQHVHRNVNLSLDLEHTMCYLCYSNTAFSLGVPHTSPLVDFEEIHQLNVNCHDMTDIHGCYPTQI